MTTKPGCTHAPLFRITEGAAGARTPWWATCWPPQKRMIVARLRLETKPDGTRYLTGTTLLDDGRGWPLALRRTSDAEWTLFEIGPRRINTDEQTVPLICGGGNGCCTGIIDVVVNENRGTRSRGRELHHSYRDARRPRPPFDANLRHAFAAWNTWEDLGFAATVR